MITVCLRSMVLASLALGPLRQASAWQSVPDARPDKSIYKIGVGIHDATGPAADVNMMGYANPSQINQGIHIRLFARAFIIDDGERRLVFVSVDCGMMSQSIRMKVIEKLVETYGDIYSYKNVILSGTHTHSGPAGYLQYLLFDLTSLGFIQETFDAMVEGTYKSIVKAHENMKDGYIYMSEGNLFDAAINRSPFSYKNNPQEEQDKYESDTDKLMTLLRFEDIQGRALGMLNWFAVHPTSMNSTNVLISGDNKGYASQLFEAKMNEDLPGHGAFVAAFAQSSCGDVSPNTKGARCRDSGHPCEERTSTCSGKAQLCIADGPGDNMMHSTQIIGQKQFEKAWELFTNKNAKKLSGPIQFVQQNVDMANYTVVFHDGRTERTCEPALGYSFAAGTIDGPGALNFYQGITEALPLWDIVLSHVLPPRPEQVECHSPKPILLDTGNLNIPYPWHPRIMESQIGRIGQLFILAVPGEFTTMAGRRLREKINELTRANGIEHSTSVIAGLSNVYSHYITTFEEYQIQRYEAASTIFGPHTLDAYVQKYSFLLQSMADNTFVPDGPAPPNLSEEQLTFLPGILFDNPGFWKKFGDVVAQPIPLVYPGETQMAIFVAGHPRNNVSLGGTFLEIEKEIDEGIWSVVANDASWETRFVWKRISLLLGTSEAIVYWDVPCDAEVGTYRIRHVGHWKDLVSGKIYEYSGKTNSFKVY